MRQMERYDKIVKSSTNLKGDLVLQRDVLRNTNQIPLKFLNNDGNFL